MRRLHAFVLPLMAGLLLLAASGQAQAGTITFGLQVSPNPVDPGGALTADIYLEETDGTILSDVGIFAAAFKVTFSNATQSGPVSTNAGFDLVNITEAPDSVSFDLTAFFNPNVKSDPATPDMLYLGSVFLTAVDPGSVSVSVQILDPTLDNVVDGNQTPLDQELGNPSVLVSVIPEPASIVMLSAGALAGLGLMGYRRRRVA